MAKVLTVVVPTYNMEKYLDRCLSSLIVEDEKMDILEVLVVNDGSKDRSSEIARGYEVRYPQTFRVIDKENGNYGSCVNRGMDEATGKYFRILDADDWFNSYNLSSFLETLNNVSEDIIFSNYTIYRSGSTSTTSFPHCITYKVPYYIENSFGDILRFHRTEVPQYIRMHQMTMLLSLLKDSNFRLQSGISYTDTEFCYFPCKIAKSFLYTDVDLYQYDLSREGQTMSRDSRKKLLSNMVDIAKRLLEDYNEMPECNNKVLASFSLKSILYVFYQTALFYCKNEGTVRARLKTVDSLVRMDSQLCDYCQSWVYRRIRYVALWQKTGLSFTSIPLVIYDRCWDLMKKLKTSLTSNS